MMGNLFIDSENLEIHEIKLTERDNKIKDFIDALECIKKNRDVLYSVDLDQEKFSYGNLFNDFIFPTWEAFRSNPNLRGVSQTTYELFYSSMFQLPSLVSTEPFTKTSFDHQFSGTHYGYTGFYQDNSTSKYVHSPDSHFKWVCDWLCLHQDEIKWNTTETWLPNKVKIEKILLSELSKQRIRVPDNPTEDEICNLFYEDVMKKKSGDSPEAYIQDVASRILETNYYIREEELTRKEAQMCDSKRLIFSVINPDKKKQYISIDYKHGMFEYHDQNGKHLGEYRFNGQLNKAADNSHNLRCLP